MNHLSDFKPLKRITLPGMGDLECAGLTLVVGPNSSGKSQLLQDLYHRIAGEPRTLVVASEIEIDKPAEVDSFLDTLQEEGYIEMVEDENGTKQVKSLTVYPGSGPVSQIQRSQAADWYQSFSPISGIVTKRRSEFLNHFGRLLVTGLFLARRLDSLNQVGLIDFQTQSPQHDLHALVVNDIARKELFDEVVSSFGKGIWPDMSRGNGLCLRVADEGVLPTAEDRLSSKKMAAFRTIETEGDGLKSYVAICISLLLGIRPVVLLDEPEMCLHPPQAYNLGRFIGSHGTSPETATFVSTHSSHILRGVLQTAPGVRIVRLTRKGKDFVAHQVPANTLAEAVAKPTLRAESVLDGIFSQAVVILEADGDRLVYQTTWETLANEKRLDIHFAPVGGTGGIADTCHLYKTLNIPLAVIADLDLLSNNDRLTRVLHEMTTPDIAQGIMKDINKVMDEIRKMPPTVTSDGVRKALERLLSNPMDWDKQDDAVVCKELRGTANTLDRMRRLKSGGVDGFPEDIASPMRLVVVRLSAIGIFVVPVGELEEWLKSASIKESKANKWAWASAAAQHIQRSGVQQGDVWDFMRSVGAYLIEQAQTI